MNNRVVVWVARGHKLNPLVFYNSFNWCKCEISEYFMPFLKKFWNQRKQISLNTPWTNPKWSAKSMDQPNKATFLFNRKTRKPYLFGGQRFFVFFLEPYFLPFWKLEGTLSRTGHQDALQWRDWTNPRLLFDLSDWISGILNHQIHWVQRQPFVCQTRSNPKLNCICSYVLFRSFSTISLCEDCINQKSFIIVLESLNHKVQQSDLLRTVSCLDQIIRGHDRHFVAIMSPVHSGKFRSE